MTHQLMKLPFDLNALTPYISKETLEYHYGKHHQTYVTNLNNLLLSSDSNLKNLPLKELISKTATGPLYNNAAQVFNHDFYWQSLTDKKMTPSEEVLDLINRSFDSLDKFKAAFTSKALSLFGSGWTWLTYNGKILEILTTSNAQVPDAKLLLVCDVWEHAYYIDYKNARAKYLDAFMSLINWDFVLTNLQ